LVFCFSCASGAHTLSNWEHPRHPLSALSPLSAPIGSYPGLCLWNCASICVVHFCIGSHHPKGATQALHTWLWKITLISEFAQILIKDTTIDKTHVQEIQGRYLIIKKQRDAPLPHKGLVKFTTAIQSMIIISII
jgi:hypothetical protein